jgi:hypothetical protein
VLCVKDQGIAAVQSKSDPPIAAFAFTLHFNRTKGCRFHLDVELFDWGYEDVPPIRLAPQHSREEANHCRSPDRPAIVIPGAVASYSHPRMATALWVPLVDRRKGARLEQLLQLGKADPAKIDWRAALWHCGAN